MYSVEMQGLPMLVLVLLSDPLYDTPKLSLKDLRIYAYPNDRQ